MFSQNVHFKGKSIALSFALNVSPKTFKRYVDDNHARFKSKKKSLQFLEILNKQDPFVRYVNEFENDRKQLNFLDIIITNNGTNSIDLNPLMSGGNKKVTHT